MPGIIRQSYAAFACSIGVASYGMVYGWVSPVLNHLTDPNGEIRATKEQVSWIAAAIEFGCLATPIIASFLMDSYGRKWPMIFTVPLLVISWVLTITTRSVVVLYIKRVLDGMGLGIALTIGPVYLAEIAEAKIRGFIILSTTVSWYFGTLVQFCIGTYLSYSTTAWINLVVPIVFFSLFSFLPDSPYYLMKRGLKDKAAESLAWYRGSHPTKVLKELSDIAQYLEEDSKNKESWTVLFTNKIYRMCLFIMIVITLATVMTGVTTIPSYASEMFSETDGFLNAETCSVAIALLFFVTNFFICLVIDKIGRRPLLILSAFGCFISNLFSSVYFCYKDEILYSWVPFVTIGLYCIFVSIGLNPIMISFQGELFPSSVKSKASGLIMIFTTLVSLVTVKLYYVIGSTVGLHVNYLFYAMVAGVSTIWLYFYAPETKNKTFHELFQEFERLYGTVNLNNLEELKKLRNHRS